MVPWPCHNAYSNANRQTGTASRRSASEDTYAACCAASHPSTEASRTYRIPEAHGRMRAPQLIAENGRRTPYRRSSIHERRRGSPVGRYHGRAARAGDTRRLGTGDPPPRLAEGRYAVASATWSAPGASKVMAYYVYDLVQLLPKLPVAALMRLDLSLASCVPTL